MILAIQLKFVMSFSNYISNVVINLNRQRLIGFNIAVALAFTLRTLKLSLYSDLSCPILRIGDHFCGHTVSAGRISAAHHKYGLSVCHVKPEAAIKAI